MSDKEWEKLFKQFLTRILMQSRIKSESLRKFRMKQLLRQQLMHRQGRRQMRLQAQTESAATNGFASDVKTEDEEWIEENSWTYDMKTEDQTILHKAAIANEKAQDSLSKSQELMLTGDTTEGVSKTEGATESASCDDESGEKVWTVTAYTEQGITCKEFKDGVGTLLWQIDFKNPTDYNKVMDYLDNEKRRGYIKVCQG